MLNGKARLLALAAALLAPAALSAQYSQPVRDVENPAANAHLIQGTLNIVPGIANNLHSFSAIPVGKRLTIESLGLTCTTTPNTTSVFVTLSVPMQNTPNSAANVGRFPIQMVRQGPQFNASETAWVGTLNGRVFLDNNGVSLLQSLNVRRYPLSEPLNCSYAIMGGLTNLPQ